MVDFNLTGKVALVTGSTQGIGYAIAKTLKEYGAEVIVHGAKNYEKAKRAADEIGAKRAIVCDLSDFEQTKKLPSLTGEVDLLILNASVQFRNPPQAVTEEEFAKQLTVNFKSSFYLMNAYLPHMQKQGFGRVITIGSTQQYRPHPQMPVYAATKCAVMSIVENMARQYSSFGVTFNNVAPGAIATPRNDEALADPSYKQKVVSGIPCGYIGEADDIAGVALLLCSEAGRYINGANIPVDGGMKL